MLSYMLGQQRVEKSLEGAVAAQLRMLFPVFHTACGGELSKGLRTRFYLLETCYAPAGFGSAKFLVPSRASAKPKATPATTLPREGAAGRGLGVLLCWVLVILSSRMKAVSDIYS